MKVNKRIQKIKEKAFRNIYFGLDSRNKLSTLSWCSDQNESFKFILVRKGFINTRYCNDTYETSHRLSDSNYSGYSKSLQILSMRKNHEM